jgi:hypothetical protein
LSEKAVIQLEIECVGLKTKPDNIDTKSLHAVSFFEISGQIYTNCLILTVWLAVFWSSLSSRPMPSG